MTDKNSTPMRPMVVECPGCERAVLAEPRGSMYFDDRQSPPERWTLLQCAEQGHPLLVVQNEFFGVSFDEDSPWRAYPPSDRPLSDEIPQQLRQSHDEARKCFNGKGYKGAIVMSGVTLEGACRLHNIPKGTLQDMLLKMRDQQLIDGRLWEWADSLRDVRNAASHFNDEELTRQDAEDALAFSEALLDYLYVLSARFNAMKQRRSRSAPQSEKILTTFTHEDGSGENR